MKEKLLISACLLGVGCRYDGCRIAKVDAAALSEKFDLVPICPEIYGGLPTPRTPSERIGDRVVMKDGTDVTENFVRGMEHTLDIAKACGARLALMKAKSPSCGKGDIYDGSFSGKLTEGNGYTVDALLKEGFSVYTEAELDKLLSR